MGMVKTILTGAVMALLPLAAAAQDLLLTVKNGDEIREYDRAAMEALPATSFTTTTIWTEGDQNLTGVLLADFLEDAGITSGTLKAYAVNDYAVEIPVADGVEGGPIIAYELNGAPMPVRNKGPYWIVYPYDLNPEYQSEIYHSRSIWQLVRLEVLE